MDHGCSLVKVIALKPSEIENQWPILKPYIEMALEYSLGEMSAEEVKEDGIKGIYLFLAFYRDDEILGLITVETVVYSRKKIVCVPHVGGKEIDEWCGLMVDTVKNLAKEQGASNVISYGRQGWLKKLSPYGFKTQYTILSLTL